MNETQVGVAVEVDLAPVADDALITVEISRDRMPVMTVPGFVGSDGVARFRFAPATVGRFEFTATPESVGRVQGTIEAGPYRGDNELVRHGRIRVAEDRRTLEHSDGTPFLWLGDTWWMGLGKRLDWPDGFDRLLNDRVSKGFSVIQLVAGPLPDFSHTPEGIWHAQQANDGGWPWEPGWARLNPGYFDDADKRIAAIVEAGLVPCIVGMWGYYEHVMGAERVMRHWRELVARYAAYPVVFCVAGEINLAGYDNETEREVRDARRTRQLQTWTEVAREVHRLDAYDNLVTAHPASPDARSLLPDQGAIDVNMIQTSHWSYHLPAEDWRRELGRDLGLDEPLRMGFFGAVGMTLDTVAQRPPMPLINAEPCYEGILGGNWQDVQRFNFWTGWLSGLAGYTYGADGIWQMSSDAEAFANEVSRWGDTSWQRAMGYEGGRQVAAGAGLLRGLEWWRLLPVPPARAQEAGRIAAFGATSDELSIYYLPSILVEERLRGMRDLPVDVPSIGSWSARYVDPANLTEHAIDVIEPTADGDWRPPEPPTFADWILIMERQGS